MLRVGTSLCLARDATPAPTAHRKSTTAANPRQAHRAPRYCKNLARPSLSEPILIHLKTRVSRTCDRRSSEIPGGRAASSRQRKRTSDADTSERRRHILLQGNKYRTSRSNEAQWRTRAPRPLLPGRSLKVGSRFSGPASARAQR